MAGTGETGTALPIEGELDVRYYAGVLWRGRALIATAALVALGLGILVGFLQVPEYRATVLLQIEPPVPTFLTVTDALVGGGNYWQNTDFYNTQFKILRSKGVGERVVERLALKDTPAFKEAADAAGTLMGHVAVEPIPESRLVNVHVIHPEPKTAALWANTLADVYIEQSLSTRVEAAKRAYEWLQERLAATQQEMRVAQEKLFQTYRSQDLFVPEGSVSAVASSISKLNADFVDAQARRIALEAALKQVAAMRAGGEALDNVPQVAGDAVVQGFGGQLTAFGLELTRLKEKYKEGHPEVQRVLAQVEQVRKARDARAGQIVDGMRAEYAQLQKRETELRQAVEAQKAQAAQQSRKSTELETLRKEADSAKNLYDVLLQKLNETDIAASIRANNVSLVEQAVAPRSPVRPNKQRIAGMAFLLGLLLGVGLVLGRDYLDNTIKDPEELERYLHLDLIAAVPRYQDQNTHLVTEAYQSLRTALIFGRKDERGQLLLVASTAPQEGKTTTLVNTAKLLASSGERTLLIDLDLRRPTLHAQLGLTREPGVTDIFARHEELELVLRPTRVPNLHVMTAGPTPPNPPALLGRKAFVEMLERLRAQFDWVLLDSPPIASVTDALLLARLADLVVFVVQHNKVDKKLAKRALASLRKVTPNVLGAVLNVVDLKTQDYYYYYYHHAGAEQEKPAAPRAVAAGER